MKNDIVDITAHEVDSSMEVMEVKIPQEISYGCNLLHLNSSLPITKAKGDDPEPCIALEFEEPKIQHDQNFFEDLKKAMELVETDDAVDNVNLTTNSQTLTKAHQAVALEHAFKGSTLALEHAFKGPTPSHGVGICTRRETMWSSVLRRLPSSSRKRRHYWIDADDKSLRWRSRKKDPTDTRIPLEEIDDIQISNAQRRRSFVLKLHDGTSIRLRAQDRAQMKLWVHALRIACDPSKYGGKKRPSDLFHDWVHTLDASMIVSMLEDR